MVNAGGVVNISVEFDEDGYDPQVAARRVDAIEGRVAAVLAEAEGRGLTPVEAATALARERIHRARPRPSGALDVVTVGSGR